MRKIILRGLCVLFLSALCSQAFAGKVAFCEDDKDELKALGLYGLCNAYWNATNENARARILANFEALAPDDVTMPGLEPPPDPEPEFTCPCWDYDLLVQALACRSEPLEISWVLPDDSGDGSGFDAVSFGGIVQLFAGHTFFQYYAPETECVVANFSGSAFVKAPSAPTSEGEDAACRMDVLDLAVVPPTLDECDTP